MLHGRAPPPDRETVGWPDTNLAQLAAALPAYRPSDGPTFASAPGRTTGGCCATGTHVLKHIALENAGVLASVSQLHTPSCPQKALQKLQHQKKRERPRTSKWDQKIPTSRCALIPKDGPFCRHSDNVPFY